MDTLSIGMSDDLIPAIRKTGATIVRIGRAIFGDRQLILALWVLAQWLKQSRGDDQREPTSNIRLSRSLTIGVR